MDEINKEKKLKIKKKTQVFNKEVSLKCLYEILKDILKKNMYDRFKY